MILHADARTLPIADACVDCCVTSPPYWGLRDYGHAGQLGLEPTPEAYVAALVGVFREVWRVLKPAGTVWLNLGDSYSRMQPDNVPQSKNLRVMPPSMRERVVDLAPKNLVGIPWRVAFALQADGWYLRSDIIWHKPNPMPESVTDRPTKAHEYLFLLTKAERYYYDAAAIAEPFSPNNWHPNGTPKAGRIPGTIERGYPGQPQLRNSSSQRLQGDGRNARSVWTIPTQCFFGAHFATMPEALIEPCILAGCPLGGLVLDPFLGSGTVGAVAERLGRRWLGCDLAYHRLAKARTAQRGFRFPDLVPA